MKDMQATGNSITLFSENLLQLIRYTNYYTKSGYFSPNRREISLIYSFYTELSKMILVAKTDTKSMTERRELYDAYCKIRHMLSQSVFVNVTLITKEERDAYTKQTSSSHFAHISGLYSKCKSEFPSRAPSAEIHSADVSESFYKRDVLIGLLRNREQLDICLGKGFYHIPCEKLSLPVENLSYVAVYQSKNLYGRYSCIEHYGKIDSYEIVKRKDITEIPKNSDKEYYRFNISEWKKLPKPISNSGGGVCETTSEYLLLTSDDICELSFKDLNICKLYRTIRKSIVSKRNKVACRYRYLTFVLEDNTVCLYVNRKKLYSVSTKEYLSNPSKHFWSMLSAGKNNRNKL